jgi:Flp pilus assembly pilin Flp
MPFVSLFCFPKLKRQLLNSPEGASERRRRLSNERGQGLIEYLVIVALMGVATIAIVRVMGQTVSSRFASITYALQGKKKAVEVESIDSGLYKKKDLGNFFDGVGESKSSGANR